ncbi:GNAT family N-acetyltransferase, partial [Actinoplanes sp. NPDC048791]|uniref:GNAT family N-acetyltransferase n=1 Tax=Actinoplanes sp. NPDC048791 TaxID=3154623 RepID=UPI0033CD22CC
METVAIRTGDLLLRPWHARDAEAVCRACQDPELHRRLTGLPWPYRISDAAAFVGEFALPSLPAYGTPALPASSARAGRRAPVDGVKSM